jgi:methionine-rich copper-binding protein CopC
VRRGPALVLAIALGAAAVLGIADPASAHNQIVSSTPAPNETLTSLPATFAIDTNNVLLDIGGTGRGFAFEIQDSHGQYYETGCVSIVDDNMFTDARLGAAGAYTIIFQIVSADGHTVSGTIPFTWAPTGSATVTKGVSSPPGCNGGPAPGKPHTDATSTQTTRTSTVPIADVLWIGGIIVVVAIAAILTLVILTRRRRDDDGDADAEDDASAG